MVTTRQLELHGAHPQTGRERGWQIRSIGAPQIQNVSLACLISRDRGERWTDYGEVHVHVVLKPTLSEREPWGALWAIVSFEEVSSHQLFLDMFGRGPLHTHGRTESTYFIVGSHTDHLTPAIHSRGACE